VSERIIKYAVLQLFTGENCKLIVQRVIYSAGWKVVPQSVKKLVKAKFTNARLLFFASELEEHYNGDSNIREKV
jgi:hypothetical protein